MDDPVTEAELDEWEASLDDPGPNLLPRPVAEAMIAAERARLARATAIRHALAGHPLGRPTA